MIKRDASSYQLGFNANRKLEQNRKVIHSMGQAGNNAHEGKKVLAGKSFIVDISKYIGLKFRRGISYTQNVYKHSSDYVFLVKGYVVRNIFLGRGVLYRPIFQFSIAFLTLVLAFTGVLNNFSINFEKESVVFASGQDILTEYGTGKVAAVKSDVRTDVVTHKVAPGETLESIAKKYDITVETIKWANGINDWENTIKPGQILTILPVEGVMHTVAEGDTLESIAKKYSASPQAIADWNWLDPPDFKVYKGDKIIVPGGKIAPKARPKPKPIATRPKSNYNYIPTPYSPSTSSSGNVPTKKFGRAVEPGCGVVTQWMHRWHKGIDIAQRGGCKELAIESGTVTVAGWTAYGFAVFIDHGNGWSSVYGHGDGTFYVKAGQRVYKGQPIQYMGCTGRCTGTHLHLEVRYNGVPQNPAPLIVLP